MNGETVVRVRNGSSVELATLAPAQPRTPSVEGLDLSAFRLYLPETADVTASDDIRVRGVLHRVTELPHLRVGFALVVEVEQATAGAGAFDCLVAVRARAAAPTFNRELGQTESAAGPVVYTGAAQVTASPLSTGNTADVGGDLINARTYLVRLPAGAGDVVDVDHVVTVTAAPNADLVGRRLHVLSVARPGREADHELVTRLYD